MKKDLKKITCLAIMCMFTSAIFFMHNNIAKADSTAYYVSSTNGDDNNNGSIDSPWKTIQKAANTVKSGEEVFVRGGTYKEKVKMKTSGAANAYITFKNFEGETPIID